MASSAPDPAGPRHGGDLALATRLYGKPPEGWLDLSTGVNPSPYPVRDVPAEAFTRLPEPDAFAAVLAAARTSYGIPPAGGVVAAPGSEVAIRLVPLLAPPGSVAIVSPTYGSHREAWRSAGRTVIEVDRLEAIPATASIVVLANPNNPDGRLHSQPGLLSLARRLRDRDGLLVVDEAFGDLIPASTLAGATAELPVIILRSFGKFYGLPGLRLGFVAGPPAFVDRLGALLGDWPVSGPALAIGRRALADTAWQEHARASLAASAARLRTILLAHGLTISGGTDLFVLASHPDAAAVHRHLARGGIWTRVFGGHPTWLRIGLPGHEAGFNRLDRALADRSAPTG